MIEIDNLHIAYGSFKAVDGISLTIGTGELFAFLGPNGAGKTSTIRAMVGLLRPEQGSIQIAGYDIQEQPMEAKRRLGYVPDVAVFYEKLSVVEFLGFIADIFDVNPAEAEIEAAALLETFQLGCHAHQRIEELSHGTRQRVAIAAALLHRPDVFVIDEPMVGLDPILAKVVKNELKVRSQAGMTVFMSTHLLNVAEELADRIGIVHKGKLLFLGTLDELRSEAVAEGKSLEMIFLDMLE